MASDELRPLVAGSVRWPEGAVEIDLDVEVVRVEGEDVALLRAVLGDCDGRTPLAALAARHGPQAAELVAALHERGAVVDAEQAWRVAHRHGSAGTLLGRGIPEAELPALQRARHRPVTGDDPGVPPAPVAPGPLAGLLAARRSARPGEPASPVTFAGLSAVLRAAYAYAPRGDGSGPGGATVPSAGGLYPLLVHVLVPALLPPLAPGLWWHDPATLALHRLADPPAAVAGLLADAGGLALVDNGQPTVFLSADLERPSRKYGARGYRFALMEAGASLEAAMLAAAEAGVPVRALGGIDDRALHAYLGLPDAAVALLAVSLGT